MRPEAEHLSAYLMGSFLMFLACLFVFMGIIAPSDRGWASTTMGIVLLIMWVIMLVGYSYLTGKAQAKTVL